MTADRPAPALTDEEFPEHAAFIARTKATDAAIQDYDRSVGVNPSEVTPAQRRAFVAGLAEGIRRERERCANIADSAADDDDHDPFCCQPLARSYGDFVIEPERPAKPVVFTVDCRIEPGSQYLTKGLILAGGSEFGFYVTTVDGKLMLKLLDSSKPLFLEKGTKFVMEIE